MFVLLNSIIVIDIEFDHQFILIVVADNER